MKTGKSKGERHPFGERRTANGLVLAPKSLRIKGKLYLKDCTDTELEKAGVK